MEIIHFILGKANPERMNGVNKVVHELTLSQNDLKLNVSIWGVTKNTDENHPERKIKSNYFKAHSIPFFVDKSIINAIENCDPQQTIFHFHGAFIPLFFAVIQVLNRKKIPFVYTPHGAFAEGAIAKNKWVKLLYFHLFEKRIIKSAKAVHVLGENEKANLLKLSPNIDNMKLISNGIHADKLILKNTNVQNLYPIFGFCGRIDMNHKGLDILLKGFEIYCKNGGLGKLIVIGDGEDLPKLKKMAIDLSINEKVQFTGALFGLEKQTLMASFDYFLHPSRMEGFPMAVLESAAIGVPTITSEETNINNFIRNYKSGFTLSKNNPETLALQLEKAGKIYLTEVYTSLSQNAIRMVKECFTWKKIATSINEKLYQI